MGCGLINAALAPQGEYGVDCEIAGDAACVDGAECFAPEGQSFGCFVPASENDFCFMAAAFEGVGACVEDLACTPQSGPPVISGDSGECRPVGTVTRLVGELRISDDDDVWGGDTGCRGEGPRQVFVVSNNTNSSKFVHVFQSKENARTQCPSDLFLSAVADATSFFAAPAESGCEAFDDDSGPSLCAALVVAVPANGSVAVISSCLVSSCSGEDVDYQLNVVGLDGFAPQVTPLQ